MNNDLSILHLISNPGVVVQLVMLILFYSVVSWTFIFAKRKELKQAVRVTDEFEAHFPGLGFNPACIPSLLQRVSGLRAWENLFFLAF
ncbi:MAG: hypothetical protein H0A75_01735 [Candidatus Methanofishera endochildressiae]|uniref:Protein TolQ n=1 Tax=Candidatus Methanofishera endochildressiae TaxID=2738884 RepID=A0A7Z0MMW7_9GAMM|nr:hypothetical protein [Candidatus Methanofishera endochildressiae]